MEAAAAWAFLCFCSTWTISSLFLLARMWQPSCNTGNSTTQSQSRQATEPQHYLALSCHGHRSVTNVTSHVGTTTYHCLWHHQSLSCRHHHQSLTYWQHYQLLTCQHHLLSTTSGQHQSQLTQQHHQSVNPAIQVIPIPITNIQTLPVTVMLNTNTSHTLKLTPISHSFTVFRLSNTSINAYKPMGCFIMSNTTT